MKNLKRFSHLESPSKVIETGIIIWNYKVEKFYFGKRELYRAAPDDKMKSLFRQIKDD